MIRHPVPDEVLLDYASGALPEGPSLAVAVHLELCAESRSRLAELEAVGGVLLDSVAPEAIDAAGLDAVLTRLDEPAPATLPMPRPDAEFAALPAALHPYLPPGTRWHKPFFGPSEIVLPTRSKSHLALLLRIEPGGSIPQHVHEDLEYTTLISGAFHDGFSEYSRGDMCVVSGIEHTPVAIGEEICVCIVVYRNPIILSGTFGRLINPRRWFRHRL